MKEVGTTKKTPTYPMRITVAAQAGCGKTTIAELLQQFLTEQGFNSTHVEYEVLSRSFYSDESRERRIEAGKEHLEIEIIEHQPPRF